MADAYNNRIQLFESDGSFRSKWGGPLGLGILGWWPGWFNVATGVTVGPAGRVYVADFYNDRIQVFSQAGKLLGVIGDTGDELGQLERPTDVVVAEDGSIYVVPPTAETEKPNDPDAPVTPPLPKKRALPNPAGPPAR